MDDVIIEIFKMDICELFTTDSKFKGTMATH